MKRTLSLVLAALLICSCFATVSFAADTKPAEPKISYVKNAYNGISVKWEAVENATSYIIYRKVNNATNWTNLGSVNGNSTVVYTDKNVKTGAKYTYTVRSVSDTVKGGFSETGKSVLFVAMPRLVSCVNTSNSCKFTWTKVAGAIGYKVFKKSSTGWQRIATIANASTLSYNDKNVKSGVNNTYTVLAYIDSTASAYSTSGLSCVFLTAPQITSYSKSGANNTLKWGKVAGASTYYVYRKNLSSGWKKIASTSKLYYTDAASASVVCTYTVRAVKGSSLSANSAEKTPWNMNSKASVFYFYKCAANSIKSGKAGFTYNIVASRTNFYYDDTKQKDYSVSNSVVCPKGYEAADAFPACTLKNLDKIVSYSVKDNGSYYTIKMKLAPEKNVASAKYSYINQVSDLCLTKEDFLAGADASGIKSFNFTNTLTITANIYKTGKIGLVVHSINCPLSAKLNKLPSGTIDMEYTTKIIEKYSSFKY